LGRFIDASYAYRFGPPGHDVLAVSLHEPDNQLPVAQCFRFSVQRPTSQSHISELGLTAEAKALSDGTVEVVLSARRFASGVRISSSGFLPDDCYFGLEPGHKRRITLAPLSPRRAPANVAVSAVNAQSRLTVPVSKWE